MNRKVSAWWRRTTGAAFALGLLAVAGLPLQGAWAQGAQGEAAPRMRVIIDNDFSGDPDGLFQLAHHLLSPSVEVRGIIGSHVKGFGGDAAGTATAACRKVGELLEVMGLEGRYRVCEGSNRGMDAPDVPAPSEGARLIVEEAMRNDTDTPLYIVCGASLTTVASAWLMEAKMNH